MGDLPFDLFPFQEEGVDKLWTEKSRLVGDDMGLGKTYTGIALDLMDRKIYLTPDQRIRRKTLIICPKSVISVWDNHLCDLAPDMYDVRVIGNTQRERAKFLAAALNPKHGGYFIMNWEALRTFPELHKVYWFHVIADECHRAKNRKAQQTRALKRLKAEFKTAMSGTPADNKPQDLWSILNWLFPRTYTSYWKFYKRYIDYEISYPHGYHKMLGLTEHIGELHKQMEPWYIRRHKEDVLKDLPEKYYTQIEVELTPKQRRAYDQMRKTMIAWVDAHQEDIETEHPLITSAVIAQLTRLQQFAVGYMVPKYDSNGDMMFTKRSMEEDYEGEPIPVYEMDEPSSKLDVLMELIEDNEDEPIVVFSQFKSAINLLARRLDKDKIPYGLITGDISQPDRARYIEEFQAGKLRIIAGTIRAGGVGVTLTAARTAVFLDRGWSPSINTQAEDRLHRIGQRRNVHIIDVVAKRTIDQGKDQQLRMKMGWLKKLLDV